MFNCNEEMKEIWKSHFECLMNEKTEGSNNIEHKYGNRWNDNDKLISDDKGMVSILNLTLSRLYEEK